MAAEIRVFPCLSDNIGYLIHDPATKATAAIDAPESAPVIAALEREGWRLTDLLITHHHADHTDGIAELKAKYKCRVVGPFEKGAHIDGLDIHVKEGDTVKVGNLAAQVFQAAGYEVNAFDLSPHRRDIARECGIKSVHGADAMKEFSQQHRLIVECTGSAKALASVIDMAAPGGEIVMIGAPWGGEANSVPSSQITRLLFFRFLRLRSGSEWEIPRQPTPLSPGSNHQNSVTALDWLASGKLKVQPIITHRIKPAEAAAAYDGLLNRPNDYLGVIIDWSGESAAQ